MACVTGAFRGEWKIVDASQTPAGAEYATSVRCRELAVTIDDGARGRSAANFHQARRCVKKPWRSVPTARPSRKHPAMVHSCGYVKQTRGAVPREILVPLAVGVHHKDRTAGVDGQ